MPKRKTKTSEPITFKGRWGKDRFKATMLVHSEEAGLRLANKADLRLAGYVRKPPTVKKDPHDTWWAINGQSVATMRREIAAAIKAGDILCKIRGCTCMGTHSVRCTQGLSDALHELDSGLHRLEKPPEDWWR